MKRMLRPIGLSLAVFMLALGLGGCVGGQTAPSSPGPCSAPTDGSVTADQAAWINHTCQHQWYLDGLHRQPFLVCTRAHESDGGDVNRNGLHDGGYGAIGGGGLYRGAYQFLRSTWDAAVQRMHDAEPGGLWGFLVGQDPATVGVVEQDSVAWSHSAGGRNTAPWGGRCGGMAG